MQTSPPAEYKLGDRVRVGKHNPSGHCRTPTYIRGKSGRVIRLYGSFRKPESLAYRGSGLPKQFLYQVEFEQGEVWDQYSGSSQDKVWIDIYQHWLEPI